MYYRVYDNSFCINLENGNYASLVQVHDECGYHYGKKEFINVKSTFTGNIYRVLYNKYSLYC